MFEQVPVTKLLLVGRYDQSRWTLLNQPEARFLPGTIKFCVRITPLVVEVVPPVHQTFLPQPRMLLPHCLGKADPARVKQARDTVGQPKSQGSCLEIELACKPFDQSNLFEPIRGEE